MGNEFQRAFLWVILVASVFMLWDNWQVYNGKPSFFSSFAPTEEQAAAPATKEQAASVPARPAAPVQAPAGGTVPHEQTVELANDVLRLSVDTAGAVFTKAELLQERQQADWTETGLIGLVLGKQTPEPKNITLFDLSPTHVYVAQNGLIGGDFPNHKTSYRYLGSQEEKTLDPALGREVRRVTAAFEAENAGVKVRKTYSLQDGRYEVLVRDEVSNGSPAAIQPSVYYQLTRDSSKPEGESTFYSTYTGPATYTSHDKYQKIKFDNVADNKPTRSKDGWVAMVQHYFVSAWVDADPANSDEREIYTTKLGPDLYAVGSIARLGAIDPGQTVTRSELLYVGPQDQTRLEQLAKGLDLVVDYGWLTFLAKPIYSVLYFLHGLVGNWGWAIVLLTVLVKAILYPVSAAGYKSMARMKEVTPRLKALQEQYGKDKQRYQQAMMQLYKKEKINPVGGCLPIFLQIPVFLALYWVLLGSVELRGSAWMWWLTDLASPDQWFVLPAVMMITMLLQMKLNPTPTDPTQAKMMIVMPLVFGVMFFFFASGLVLYWLTNNVLSIWQQWYVNRQIARERAARAAASKSP